jgi:hypothetical protein
MSLVTQALRGLAEPGLPGKEASELEEEAEGLALVGPKGAMDQCAELEPVAVSPEHHRKASSQRGIPMAQVQGTPEDLLKRWDIGAFLHFSGHQQGGTKSRQPGADLDILGLGKMARMIGREKPFQKAGVW